MILHLKKPMIKTPPIAFTQDNFSAVLSGLKTETRRLSNGSDNPKYNVGDRGYLTEPTQVLCTNPEDSINIESCDVAYFWGDKLTSWEGISDRRWVDLAEGDTEKLCNRKTGIYSKQIARFMLKSFARYSVEITDVRIERLLDITDEAAIAEGIKSCKNIYGEVDKPYYWDYVSNAFTLSDPIQSYLSEIAAIHPPSKGKIGGWDLVKSNPWVWVYKFKLTNA